MKLPFKIIALLIILSLTGVFIYQAYWLVSFYHSTSKQTDTNIENAIKNADHIELFMRADRLSEKENKQRVTDVKADIHGEVSYSTLFKRGEVNKTSHIVIKKTMRRDGATYENERILQGNNLVNDSINIGKDQNSIDAMLRQMQQGLHSAIDINVEAINVRDFDSIMNGELKKYNLNIRHYTQIVNTNTHKVQSSSLPSSIDTKTLKMYELKYDVQGAHAYHVYTEPTDVMILKQMTGILLTSFIILVILSVSFWYLIRTILKQKTLDEMKSDFTNNITHELKTPIAITYAATDALLNFNLIDNESKREKYLHICIEQLQRLSGLVEQILSMSMEQRKTFRLNMETVIVKELADNLIEQHKIKADKPVNFTLSVEPENLSVKTDRVHTYNILSNLLDNAVKYSPEKADVSISISNSNNEFSVEVSDKGIGIAPEKQTHIFDKFYRVPTGNLHDVKGFGLGLFYVRTLAERMGGSINVKSTLGKGSTFTLKLPQHGNE
jgi:signal transduction histidine kinase